MPFEVFFHPKAKKFIEHLDSETKKRIKNKLRELKEFPESQRERLKHSNFWKMRIGEYRAIYEIDEKRQRMVVLFVGHRKKVYDDFSRLV